MTYEVVLREVRQETVQKFDRDQNCLKQVTEEVPTEVIKFRIDGYHPNLKKEILDLLMAKLG